VSKRVRLIVGLVVIVAVVGAVVLAWLWQTDPRRIAKRTLESTVLLRVANQEGELSAFGTGFVVSPGLVVTNLHVIEGGCRSNKEKKKPKADKNLKKGGVAPANPFAAGKTPAGQSPNSNKK
jgi:S1-C subfamily serine protease